MDSRVLKLQYLNLLDTEEELVFDQVAEVATLICHAPMSTITLLDTDRQWFKAKTGIEIKESPRNISICSHTVEEEEAFMVVPDLLKDERFKDNPFVLQDPKIRSYAGACLITDDGYRIGALAVYDTVVRAFTAAQIKGLRTLAEGTMRIIEEKSLKLELSEQNKVLKSIIKNMEVFNYMVAHDVKAPLRLMTSFSEVLLERSTALNFGAEELQYLQFIKDAALDLSEMVVSLLNFSKEVHIPDAAIEFINSAGIIRKIIHMLDPKGETTFNIIEPLPSLFSSRLILERVFHNVIGNAVRFMDASKAAPQVSIRCDSNREGNNFTISDNGIGMSTERIENAFKLFGSNPDYSDSSGIGLYVSNELMQRLNGSIEIQSELGVGTTVTLFFPSSS